MKPLRESQRTWRYMSFARFVWLLQKKKLWLSRADLLGDPWEITLAGEQLDYVIARHPITPVPSADERPESATERSERIVKMWRKQTYVNCWSASDHESHALWRIYCQSVEGIAIQTALGALRASVGGLPIYPVDYEVPGSNRRTPTLSDLVRKKRPMFAYEQEIRIVYVDERGAERQAPGWSLEWDPARYVETIRVHPQASNSFMETVAETIARYAPTLEDRLAWSDMNALPPF